MSIAGSDGRLADGSEHSLGLYHSAPRPESASSASPPSQVTFSSPSSSSSTSSFFSPLHFPQPLPFHPSFPQPLPGHYLPCPNSFSYFPPSLPQPPPPFSSPTPPSSSSLYPGPPRPLPSLPHLFGRLSTFNWRPHCAPTYQCNKGDDGHVVMNHMNHHHHIKHTMITMITITRSEERGGCPYTIM